MSLTLFGGSNGRCSPAAARASRGTRTQVNHFAIGARTPERSFPLRRPCDSPRNPKEDEFLDRIWGRASAPGQEAKRLADCRVAQERSVTIRLDFELEPGHAGNFHLGNEFSLPIRYNHLDAPAIDRIDNLEPIRVGR